MGSRTLPTSDGDVSHTPGLMRFNWFYETRAVFFARLVCVRARSAVFLPLSKKTERLRATQDAPRGPCRLLRFLAASRKSASSGAASRSHGQLPFAQA